MKRIYLLLVFLVSFVFANAQYTINQNLGTDSSLVTARGALKSRLITYTYADTTAANLERIRQYAGAIIYTSGTNSMWYRNSTATAWVEFTSSGSTSVNIYNSDGTLSGTRTLTGAGNDLTFTGIGNFDMSDATSAKIGTSGSNYVYVLSDLVESLELKSPFMYFTSLPEISDTTGYNVMLVDRSTGLTKSIPSTSIGGGGSTPTLQQVLTAGSILTQTNKIYNDSILYMDGRIDDVDTARFSFYGQLGSAKFGVSYPDTLDEEGYPISIGEYSFSSGKYLTTSGLNSFSTGQYNFSTGTNSFSGGGNNISSGVSSFSFGQSNTSSGFISTAIGESSTATDDVSMAFGYLNNATAPSATAFGARMTVSGAYSFGINLSRIAQTFSTDSSFFLNAQKIFLKDASLSGASNGDVLTLVNNTTGEVEWAASSGGSSLFPTTGTGTATGAVTGDLDGNTLNVINADEIQFDASLLIQFMSDASIAFNTTSGDINLTSGQDINISSTTSTAVTSSFLSLSGTDSVLIKTTGDFRIRDASIASASNGYVWTLIDNVTGEGGWAAASGGVASVQLLRDTLSYNDGSTNIINVYKKYYGQIYNDSSWASLTDFRENGGTWGTSAGAITNSSGAGTFTQTLDIKTNFKTDSGYTCLERWVFAAKVKVITGGNGFGIGTRSYSTGASYYILSQLNTSSGAGTIYVPTSSNTKSSASNLSISANDVVYVSLERDLNKLTMKMRNVTTNSAVITTTYTIDYATLNTQNMGRFCIYAFGGSFEIDSIGISSSQVVNADLSILGDSKGVSYGADYYNGVSSLLQNQYTVVNESGGYTTSSDWEKLVPEIIALAPKQVIMFNPSNDARLGVNTDSTKARYYRIEAAFRAAGINVFHLDAFYETAVSQAAWVAYIHSTRSADSIFSVYSHTFNAASVSGDGIHPTAYGYYLGYNEILNENKLSFAKSLLNFRPNDFIWANSDVAQDAYINSSSTTINNLKYLKLTGPSGGTTSGSLTTGNVPFFIEGISSRYLRGYTNTSGTFMWHHSNSGFTTYYPVQMYQSNFDLYTGSTAAQQSLTISSAGNITFNETSNSVDLRIEGDTDANLFFTDGSADFIGVGTNAPSAKFHIIRTAEQLRVGYDASNYFSTTVSSAGAVTFDATGASAGFTFSDAISGTRIIPTSTSTASASSVTPNFTTSRLYEFTALAADLTINAPTGTMQDGEWWEIYIKDDGTSRNLTWNAAYIELGVTLPTATTISKILIVGGTYNNSQYLARYVQEQL